MSVLFDLKKELKKHIDPVYQKGSQNFFKEDVKILGVRAGTLRKIGRQYYREIKHLPKKQIFDLCEELLKPGYLEYNTVAFQWAYQIGSPHYQGGARGGFEKKDYARFESWLKKYVTNWASCDDFCTHAFGALINQYPELQKKTMKWAKSKNRWLRRASAVVLIYPWTRPNPFLKEIFQVADALLEDEDDLVQKGYGWMLKVAADHHRDKVFKYIMKNKNRMPRTALRYAIEKMPDKMRKQAMAKS